MTRVGRSKAPLGRTGQRAMVIVLATLVGAVLAGCGIPASSGPQAIPQGNVPPRLLNPPPTSTTVPVGVTEPIFLVDPTLHLIARNRNIAPPANLSQVLNALLLGPTAGESLGGIQSFVSGTSNRAIATVANGVATIDFVTNPVQVVGSTQTLLGIAQIVFTATTQPGVNSVLFQIAGQPIDVPTAPDGALVATPVGQAQYKPQISGGA
ncbi:MAG: GerMN domain-containing protein [Acidimicrobiales bacterium]